MSISSTDTTIIYIFECKYGWSFYQVSKKKAINYNIYYLLKISNYLFFIL